MLRLVIEDGEGTTHIVPLIRDEITIGRQEGNTIRLTERNISRRHARLLRAGNGAAPTVIVEDLDSYNGIRLNGEKVAGKGTMGPDDLLQIGDYQLALQTEEAPIAAGRRAAAPDPTPQEEERLPEAEQGRLVVVSSNLAGQEYRLDQRELIIGRTESDENDLVINHRSISRHHAKIIFRDGTFTIIDLASSNGVKVNGEAFGTATMVNGDIVELGHVKLRYSAPGDEYVFVPADIDDVEVQSGPTIGQMVVVALLLVGVAIAAFLIVDRSRPDEDPGAGGQPAPSRAVAVPKEKAAAPAVDLDALLAEANRHLTDERWDDALAVYDRVLQSDANHPDALAGRRRARREMENEKTYRGLLSDVAAGQWADALPKLDMVDLDSAYAERTRREADRIQRGFAQDELDRGRRLIEQNDLDGARKVQQALADRPFALHEAGVLDREIADALANKQRSTAPNRPSVAVPPPVEPPPVEPPPVTPPPAEPPPARERPAEESYDALMRRALKAMASGDRNKAVRLLKQAAQKNPNDHVPHQRLCALYKALKKPDQALRHCRIWLEKEPNAAYKPPIRRTIEQLEAELSN